MTTREFNRLTDCSRCRREINDVDVKLKKIIIGPDTYRRDNLDKDPNFKYEKICVDCLR